jgi:hypothetical protein
MNEQSELFLIAAGEALGPAVRRKRALLQAGLQHRGGLFRIPDHLGKKQAPGAGQLCKRKYYRCGKWISCGHRKDHHCTPGDPLWTLLKFELSEVEGQLHLYFTYEVPIRCNVCTTSNCFTFDCGCPEFQAKEFRNPFLPQEHESLPKVSSLTMCKACGHAKRAHHKAGPRYHADGTVYPSAHGYCASLVEQNGECTDCPCRKFVNPFSKPQRLEPREIVQEPQQSELFSPGGEKVNPAEQ